MAGPSSLPWHYAEPSSVKLAKITSRIPRWRLFVVRYTPGDPKVLNVAECPGYSTASVLAGERFRIFTQGEMLHTPKLRRALAAWDASMKRRHTHRAPSRRSRWFEPAPTTGVGGAVVVGIGEPPG